MWTYSISRGTLTNAKDKVIGTGYSGAGMYKNKPQATSIVSQGPIPEGVYDICEPHNSAKTGAFVMNLFPSPMNKMFGRSAFQLHGDSIKNPGTASSGCIIMARDIRQKVWDSGDHKLTVVE